MKRTILAGVALAALLALCMAGAGCKAQEEIQNVPTPRVDTQTIILRQNWPEEEHTIVVTGNGEVIAEPDFATIRVGVAATGDTAESASAQCLERTNGIFETALNFNIARTDISLAGMEIEARSQEGSDHVNDYQAKDTITVIVRDVQNVNTILTTMIDAGASQTYAVTYSITEASTAYREALAAAMADAEEKAGVLAEAAQVQVKSVVGVTEQPYDESKLVGVDFESSAIAVAAEVVVTYLIG